MTEWTNVPYMECTKHRFYRKCPPGCLASWKTLAGTNEGRVAIIAWLKVVFSELDWSEFS